MGIPVTGTCLGRFEAFTCLRSSIPYAKDQVTSQWFPRYLISTMATWMLVGRSLA
jgi:hypothetical protein